MNSLTKHTPCVRIEANLFAKIGKALLPILSTVTKPKAYLCRIWFRRADAGDLEIFATDGNRGMVVRVPIKDTALVTIGGAFPREWERSVALSQATALIAAAKLGSCVEITPEGLIAFQDDVETVRVMCPVQDYAPRFDRVIPPITTGEPSGTSVFFDPSCLLDAATAFRALGIKHVRVQSGTPMRIDGDGYIFDLHCTAVIMQMES